MDKKIRALQQCYEEHFGENIQEHCYIEVIDGSEVILSANKEGLLLLVGKIIELCENGLTGVHYHLDEAGMADKCDKPLIIQLTKAPWQSD